MQPPSTGATATEGRLEVFLADRLNVYLYDSARHASAAAAAALATEVGDLVRTQGHAAVIFDADPSQIDFLTALTEAPGLKWTRVIGFHTGEYLGVDEAAPFSARRTLIEHLVSRVPMAEFHGLRGEAANPAAAATNYAALLGRTPPDCAALSIGEHGELAFIGPQACNFEDVALVKVVELDEASGRQLNHDSTFKPLRGVPRRALTLTVPTLMACLRLFVLATGAAKQHAVRSLLEGPIMPRCPASVLRRHLDAHLFLDCDSAAGLSGQGAKGPFA